MNEEELELIKGVGWVSKNRKKYPKWFQQWLKEMENNVNGDDDCGEMS